MKKNEIVQLIKVEVASSIASTPEAIDAETNFLSLGISSIATLKVINRISRQLDLDINPVAMFEYQTIASFAEHLSQCFLEKVS